MARKYPGLAIQAESIWSMGCSHLSCHLLRRAGRRHLLLHGEGFLLRTWDVSKPKLQPMGWRSWEDGEKGEVQ